MIFGLFGGERKRLAELIAAARAGDTDKVKQLLDKGTDINASEPESGDTALLAAIDKGQWATAEYLLSRNPDLTLEDHNGNSPLYLTVSRGDPAVAMVKRLLDAGAPVDLGPRTGENAGATPVHLCCATGANACLEVLLARGASVTQPLPDGSTPLHTAAIGGDTQTVELLCKAGGNVNALNKERRTPLHHCGITGNAKVAAALIQQGAVVDDADEEGCTPLMRAVIKNHSEVARVVLDHGANPDVMVRTGETPLYPLLVAAMNGYDDVVQVLLDKGANVTAKVAGSAAPLEAARHKGHETAARLIAAAIRKKKSEQKQAAMNAEKTRELWQRTAQAIARSDKEELRSITGGSDINSLPVDDRLLVACALGDVTMTRDLLEAGADPGRRCTEVLDGFTPLVVAVGISRSAEVASLLIEAGADVNDKWSGEATPIFEATTDQSHDLASLLIDHGADFNARLENRMTPLMFAVRNGAKRCVDLFLKAGADINAVQEENAVGAFGLALNQLDLEMAEHLLSMGAEPNFGDIDTLPLAIAEHGSLSFIHALEARGCKLVRDDQRGRMAFVSARNPDPEVFDHLLEQGADPGDGNDLGYTPLILASLNNHHHLIRRYLTRGDDASIRDIDGETALSLAIENRHEESIAAFREFRVEEGDYEGMDPEAAMLKSAENGHLGTILGLRDSGVPLNICDGYGNTPLMVAVQAGHHGVVRSLYHLGADINHRNHAGETALGLARSSGSVEIVNTLQEFGALDALTDDFSHFSAKLGGIPVYNAADTLFGRMSHPYKKNPPYENPEEDENGDDWDAKEDDEDDHDPDQQPQDESGLRASIDSKLDLLSQILHSEQLHDQLSEALLEHLTQRLENWRELNEDSQLDDDELEELDRLLGHFGLHGEEVEEVERSPLFEAVHANDVPAVRKIIKGGGDVNEVDRDGNTPLLIAVLMKQARLVREILKLGADPRQARPDGKGPLFAAVRIGEEGIVKALIQGGAEVDAPLSMEHNGIPVGGCTALYVAAAMGHLPACQELVGSGAAIDAANDLGYTPLMAAIDSGHEDVVDLLLENGASVDPDVHPRMDVAGLGGSTPLYSATRRENLVLVRKLLSHGADVDRPNANGWTSLKSAAQQGSFAIVETLLEAGADPNVADDTHYTPLMNAVSGEHEDIVSILLETRADPDIQGGERPGDDEWEPGRSALMDAAFSGNVAIARQLLNAGANPDLLNAKGRTALHSAVLSASTDMVALLLESGADPDVFGNGEERMSALDLALRRWANAPEQDRVGGISDVLDLLLQHGMPADHGLLNETALDLVTEGHLEVVDHLAERGFQVDAGHPRGGTSHLFVVAALGDDRLAAAELLLRLGADANYRNPAGLSVLSMATRNGAVRMAELLLKAGASVMDRNSANVLAYDLAVIYQHDQLIDLLIGHMNQSVPSVDRQADDGTTALMRATMASDLRTIRELLAQGADASRRDRQGESPLSHAVTRGQDEVVQVLRAAGVERLPANLVSGQETMVHAGSQGALGTILDLLDSGAPIDITDAAGDTALTAAAAHPGVIRVLAKRGANLAHRNRDGRTAYMIAAASSRIRIMQVLQEMGAPLDDPEEMSGLAQMQAMLNSLKSRTMDSDSGESPWGIEDEARGEEFLMSCMEGDATTVSREIAEGADVNYENDGGRTPLLMAVAGLSQGKTSRRRERDSEQIIDSLLAAGADPNRGFMPALILATTTGRLHLVNGLLRAGADVDAATELPTDGDGDGDGDGGTMLTTALLVALASDVNEAAMDERVSLSILQAGPDLTFAGESGSLAVHLAAEAGMTQAVREILRRMPQCLETPDDSGRTPLMRAAARNQVEATKVLLALGANRETRDMNGDQARDIAIRSGFSEIADLLSQ
jgi:serine/threonine-protein phosphatase 6 regulatory ankyrin repeat subunit B